MNRTNGFIHTFCRFAKRFSFLVVCHTHVHDVRLNDSCKNIYDRYRYYPIFPSYYPIFPSSPLFCHCIVPGLKARECQPTKLNWEVDLWTQFHISAFVFRFFSDHCAHIITWLHLKQRVHVCTQVHAPDNA